MLTAKHAENECGVIDRRFQARLQSDRYKTRMASSVEMRYQGLSGVYKGTEAKRLKEKARSSIVLLLMRWREDCHSKIYYKLLAYVKLLLCIVSTT